jgi:hypothetical protein
MILRQVERSRLFPLYLPVDGSAGEHLFGGSTGGQIYIEFVPRNSVVECPCLLCRTGRLSRLKERYPLPA